MLLATLITLTLAVGVVVAIDMRRLQSPAGAAQNWVGAAVFGNCEAYEKRSVPAADAAPDRRSSQQRCDALVTATDPNRKANSEIAIGVRRVEQEGSRATAELTLRRASGTEKATLQLRRKGPGWAVVRTAETCRVVGCP